MPVVVARGAGFVARWYPGREAGHAVAAVIRGTVAPSAGLPVTWPRDVGQVPIAYSARPGGRPEDPGDKYTSKYLDLPNTPQFAFGHGLAYTTFALTDPTVTRSDAIEVATTVTNTGPRPGTATIFLFLRDPVAAIARPTLELKRFQRATLAPGESRPLRFRLTRADLTYLGPDLRPTVEPGMLELHVGLSADPDALRSTRFTLE
jgi:beta-glucosidase